MEGLKSVLLTIVAAVFFSSCVHDPTLYPSVLYGGSYIRWAPSPVTEYHRGYWEEKLRQAEQRRNEANRNAYEAGRNRARGEELRRQGY